MSRLEDVVIKTPPSSGLSFTKNTAGSLGYDQVEGSELGGEFARQDGRHIWRHFEIDCLDLHLQALRNVARLCHEFIFLCSRQCIGESQTCFLEIRTPLDLRGCDPRWIHEFRAPEGSQRRAEDKEHDIGPNEAQTSLMKWNKYT
jgi:hypothetical protein